MIFFKCLSIRLPIFFLLTCYQPTEKVSNGYFIHLHYFALKLLSLCVYSNRISRKSIYFHLYPMKRDLSVAKIYILCSFSSHSAKIGEFENRWRAFWSSGRDFLTPARPLWRFLLRGSAKACQSSQLSEQHLIALSHFTVSISGDASAVQRAALFMVHGPGQINHFYSEETSYTHATPPTRPPPTRLLQTLLLQLLLQKDSGSKTSAGSGSDLSYAFWSGIKYISLLGLV